MDNDERSINSSDDEVPESIKISKQNILNLINSGELAEALFKSSSFREKLTEFVLTVVNSQNQGAIVWSGLVHNFIPRSEFRRDPTKNSVQVGAWLDTIAESFFEYISTPLLQTEKTKLNESAMRFWRTSKSKLVAKLTVAIFDSPQELKLPALNSDEIDVGIQERVQHFDGLDGNKAMQTWLCKHEYGQDARSLARLGQTVDEFRIEPHLLKFAIEIAKTAAGFKSKAEAKARTIKDWKLKYGSNLDDDFMTLDDESVLVEDVRSSSSAKRKVQVQEDRLDSDEEDATVVEPKRKKQKTGDRAPESPKKKAERRNTKKRSPTKKQASKAKKNQKGDDEVRLTRSKSKNK